MRIRFARYPRSRRTPFADPRTKRTAPTAIRRCAAARPIRRMPSPHPSPDSRSISAAETMGRLEGDSAEPGSHDRPAPRFRPSRGPRHSGPPSAATSSANSAISTSASACSGPSATAPAASRARTIVSPAPSGSPSRAWYRATLTSVRARARAHAISQALSQPRRDLGATDFDQPQGAIELVRHLPRCFQGLDDQTGRTGAVARLAQRRGELGQPERALIAPRNRSSRYPGLASSLLPTMQAGRSRRVSNPVARSRPMRTSLGEHDGGGNIARFRLRHGEFVQHADPGSPSRARTRTT